MDSKIIFGRNGALPRDCCSGVSVSAGRCIIDAWSVFQQRIARIFTHGEPFLSGARWSRKVLKKRIDTGSV